MSALPVQNVPDPDMVFETVAIAQVGTAAALKLKEGSGTKVYRLHELVGTMSVAGTLAIESKPAGTAVALSGAMNLNDKSGAVVPWRIEKIGCLKTAAGSALQITTATGGFNGWAIISSADA